MQVKRLSVLFVLTACALLAVLGMTQLAQARDVVGSARAPLAPAAGEVLTLTVTSDLPGALYDPGPLAANRTVYFNNQSSQIISVTAAISATDPISTYAGAPAFGSIPPLVVVPPWLVSYTAGAGAGTQPAVAFTAVTTGGLSLTHAITFAPDATDPAGELAAPPYANSGFTIAFTSTDSGSGVAGTQLWFRPPATAIWETAGPVTTSLSGELAVSPADGEGLYWFGSVITDRVGNIRDGRTITDAVQTVYDITPPDVTADAPAVSSSAPIVVSFVATDTLGGVALTELWVRPPGSVIWSASGMTATGNSGAWAYPPAAAGQYCFGAVSTDRAGNGSAPPSGAGDACTLYDPNSPVINAVSASSSLPARIYAPGLTAEGGQVYFNSAAEQQVTVAVDWSDDNQASLAGSAAFGMTPPPDTAAPWELVYTVPATAGPQEWVDLTVQDAAGLTDTAQLTLTRDIVAPVPTADALTLAAGPVPITFTASDAGGAGVATVALWAAELPTGTWAATGVVTTTAAGTFHYAPPSDGVWAWGVVAADRVENASPTPVLTDVQTMVDTTPPAASVASLPLVDTPLITVTFVATDNLSGVSLTELWVRPPTSSLWSASGLTLPGTGGTFSFTPPGPGRYYFAAVATDVAGNAGPEPTGDGDSSTLYDPGLPIIDGVSASSSRPANFYTPGLSAVGGAVYFNNSTAGQTVGLTITWVDPGQAAALLGEPAFGTTPTIVTASPWTVSYPIAVGDASEMGVQLLVTTTAALTDTASVDFVRDVTPPSVVSNGIAESSPYLHASGDTLYYSSGMGAIPAVFVIAGTASDGGAGLSHATFSPAFGDVKPDDFTPAAWSADYTVSNADSGDGQIVVTVYDHVGLSGTAGFPYLHDTVAPVPALLNVLAATASRTVTVSWQATDNRSGVATTELWVRPEGGSWVGPSLTQSGTSGVFTITLSAEGRYFLAAVSTDRVSNRSATPTGEGMAELVYDATPPDSAANSPWATNASPIGVSWAVTETLTAVDWTELWVRVGTAGVWASTGVTDTGESGTFNYVPTMEGPHYFATVAQDVVGNTEASPTDDGDSSTVYDITGPAAFINAPLYTGGDSFLVRWGATDAGAGMEPGGYYRVEYRVADGVWFDWFAATSQLSATFGPTQPVTVTQSTAYTFRVRAWDALGNPGEPVTRTVSTELQQIFLPLVLKQYTPFGNGGFEAGWDNWRHGGQLVTSLSTSVVHSGARAALLGSSTYNCNNGVPVGSGWVETDLTMPNPSTGSVDLLVWFNMWTQDSFGWSELWGYYDGLQVDINGVMVEVTGLDYGPADCGATAANSGWQLWTVSVPNRYWGKNVTLRVANYNRPDGYFNSWTYVDDISIVVTP